ncbi:MAG: rhodanese-like domain-containing protein, partial [Bacteroidota bacterium]
HRSNTTLRPKPADYASEKEGKVFIYCETAHRSPVAAKKLHRVGIRPVYDLKGGFRKWEKGGFPTAKEGEKEE